jgi:hypothetical protein
VPERAGPRRRSALYRLADRSPRAGVFRTLGRHVQRRVPRRLPGWRRPGRRRACAGGRVCARPGAGLAHRHPRHADVLSVGGGALPRRGAGPGRPSCGGRGTRLGRLRCRRGSAGCVPRRTASPPPPALPATG